MNYVCLYTVYDIIKQDIFITIAWIDVSPFALASDPLRFAAEKKTHSIQSQISLIVLHSARPMPAGLCLIRTVQTVYSVHNANEQETAGSVLRGQTHWYHRAGLHSPYPQLGTSRLHDVVSIASQLWLMISVINDNGQHLFKIA